MIRSGYALACSALLLTIALLLVGCARPFPPDILARVNRSVSFQELQKNPEHYQGVWLMLAGVIVDSRNAKEGSLIEVLQKPMDGDGRPLQTDKTEGRFLVLSEQFLDTAVYQKGRPITIIGEVAGRREQPLDQLLYQYPFLLVRDLHLWRPSTGPRFFFGVGVSHRL